MTNLSGIVRGRFYNNSCETCKNLENGKCSKSGKSVEWYVANHTKPETCKKGETK